MEFQHTPVLLNEIIYFLPESAQVIIDFTLGGAGHATGLLEQNDQSFLYGIDRDEEALSTAKARLSKFSKRFRLIHSSFSQGAQTLLDEGVKADYVIADLGVSSFQLTSQKRGFSFKHDGPLDMRMNPKDPVSAADIVNTASEQDLFRMIKKYGEESFAKKIARNIVYTRKKNEFTSTSQLSDCIKEAVPKKFHFGRIHPATKTFQAIRIEVNRELEELDQLLKLSIDLLNPGGRMAIISFHSLEDRPIKQEFKRWESPCLCPKNIPHCICDLKPVAKRINRKMIMASEAEKQENFRSRSAKLRVVEKL